jgi:hypothetical protein
MTTKLEYLKYLYTTKVLPKVIIYHTGCHLIGTDLSNDGYARTFISRIYWGIDTKMGCHRLTYQVVNNIILPKDIHVLHKCDTPNCVNPEHLFEGSNYDNVLDKMAKGRMPCMKGSSNNNSKLTEKEVLAIYSNKFLPKTKRLTIKNLQVVYNISRSAIVDILYGKNWKELTSFYDEQRLELLELRNG